MAAYNKSILTRVHYFDKIKVKKRCTMKNNSERPNISSVRTRRILRIALVGLLEQKPFNNIFVKDICKTAGVPRATFYNHFEDKYDLLSFCLAQLEKNLEPKGKFASPNEYYHALLNNAADFCIERRAYLKKISQLNNNNIFVTELQANIAALVLSHLKSKAKNLHRMRVPPESFAEYYAGALVGIIKWWINGDDCLTKNELLTVADILLNRKQDLYN